MGLGFRCRLFYHTEWECEGLLLRMTGAEGGAAGLSDAPTTPGDPARGNTTNMPRASSLPATALGALCKVGPRRTLSTSLWQRSDPVPHLQKRKLGRRGGEPLAPVPPTLPRPPVYPARMPSRGVRPRQFTALTTGPTAVPSSGEQEGPWFPRDSISWHGSHEAAVQEALRADGDP